MSLAEPKYWDGKFHQKVTKQNKICICTNVMGRLQDVSQTLKGNINALKNYERKWDAKNKMYSPRPKHNWASNGADAFRTMSMGMRKESSRTSRMNLPRTSSFDYSVFGG